MFALSLCACVNNAPRTGMPPRIFIASDVAVSCRADTVAAITKVRVYCYAGCFSCVKLRNLVQKISRSAELDQRRENPALTTGVLCSVSVVSGPLFYVTVHAHDNGIARRLPHYFVQARNFTFFVQS